MKSILSLGFLTIVTALVIAISCQKSKNDHPDDTNKEYVSASIAGRILDDNNQPVNGAVVKAGNSSATTDINGNFRFNNVSLDKNAGFIKVEKDGFFQGSRTVVVNANAVNYVSIQLIKKTVSGTVSGSTGGNITVQGGGNVVFTGNSFVNTAGNSAYTGTVSISTFFLDPRASNFTQIMPGTLRGITTANEETGLQSFGMMAVELSGAGGEKLQLAAGKTATLTFPIPAALIGQAPATIPLWSFNDTTGLWKEEGVATKQGTNYVGAVSHFSFWNCDYPYGVVDFKAVFKDQNGNAISPALVQIKTTGDATSSYGSDYTDNTGMVSGKVPKNKTLELKVFSSTCFNTLIYSQNIGPFSSNADLGTITVNMTATTQVSISGTVVNCNIAPVTNGFVDISIDSVHQRAPVTNGSFNTTFYRCSSAPTTAVITAYDLGSSQNGPATNVAVNSNTVNAGQLNACGTTLVRYLNFTFNGNVVNFAPPADSIARYSGQLPNQYTVNAYRKNQQNAEQATLTFTATGVGTVQVNYLSVYYNNRTYYHQAPANVNITEFANGFISGNLSATVRDTTTGTTAPVNLIFRTK